ncbi:MAG: zinc-ribbon domain-containing protein, partial [Myxococcales bacterium]|nr:zinc-ribbon domain-containing protein [Myxococcales bacterium]
MINVQCPQCRAPYELDENRLPEGGMKMRCPKCETKFHVHRSGDVQLEGATPGMPAGLGGDGPKAPAPPKKAGSMRKATMVGVAP